MAKEPDYILEFGGQSRPGPPRSREEAPGKRPFLAIWFRCCHTYGRLYRNKEQTAYEGGCPRCGAKVEAKIGPGGSARRMFEAS